MTGDNLTRRDALRTIGGAAAGTGFVGAAAGRGGGPRRVNVGYASPSGKRAAERRASEVHHEFAFDAVTVTVDGEAVEGLRRRPDVRYVEDDIELEAIAQDLPYGIDRVDAEVAHANGDTGDGVDLAIVDTGIDRTHPDLADNIGEGRTFTGGVSTSLGGGQDDNGHGTHCAGIADAVDNDRGVVGVSTDATLHPVKVLNASGAGLTSDIAAGVEYVADQGWDVASMSLGGGATQTLKDACQYAADRDVLLVAAAGNDGECTDCVGAPALYDTVIAVSATDSNDNLAGFSSTGPEVELAAPGASIYSTYLGGYNTLSGTSMACPHVSGAGAQLVAQGYSASEARQRLKDTAEDIGLGANESGAGLLDVASALGHASGDDL